MVVTFLRMVPLTGADILDEAACHAWIWALIRPSEGIEHIRVRAGPGIVDILAFVDSTHSLDAHDRLRRLVQRAIQNIYHLNQWRII